MIVSDNDKESCKDFSNALLVKPVLLCDLAEQKNNGRLKIAWSELANKIGLNQLLFCFG